MVNDEVSEANKKPLAIFKNSMFQQKFRPITSSGKKRIWRSLKQVLAQERALPWPSDAIHYSSINAPPSFKPAKKYSDISGLPAHYTDPQTKLYYATADEFMTVRSLPMDITAGYLALRGAPSIV
ncbi:INO80 complex subunit C [Nasonia vitripennis]|uniref:Vps72/YL1 C-terminal domain-containing protein n=1 Tax=Nasonia vitripennis TaxID=7425 RepID=A0A7M7QP69_NASVI|nr:INO80 complex subunit C [Nasonia vitripennis]XP_032451871.1 INO80 complex subunit C [Nasonia vitripennis]XP_032451872.1 INO80 complex subunit C [Nasonia vitripennis]XP_032451873.1 INO80 complex subunit C [Nasonia vitripennis]XP_032451874.1 INO80 complex subunit C [Nasonia vitripennis]XP_032451875.1 INO80 complex subunit C [Nasonia vitripennis]XP_032451876.1 INO80 complex subunit C [Nasonia vitripennis]XP_032451877.1 INO80 complex subunit C [Nasonia vitripennis]XP_032451878.1 INO80 comple